MVHITELIGILMQPVPANLGIGEGRLSQRGEFMLRTKVLVWILVLVALSVASCGGGGGGDQIPIYGITDVPGGANDPFSDFDPSLVIPEPEVFRPATSGQIAQTGSRLRNRFS